MHLLRMRYADIFVMFETGGIRQTSLERYLVYLFFSEAKASVPVA